MTNATTVVVPLTAAHADEVVAIHQADIAEGRPVRVRGVVEHSVYVHPEARGRGVASLLLAALVESAEAAGRRDVVLSERRSPQVS